MNYLKKTYIILSILLINSPIFSQRLKDNETYYPAYVAQYDFLNENNAIWAIKTITGWGVGYDWTNPLQSVNMFYSSDTLVIQAYHNVLSIVANGGIEIDTVSLPDDWICEGNVLIYELFAILDYGDHIDTVPGYPDTITCSNSAISEQLNEDMSEIYPNPSSNLVTINNARDKVISMYSLSGILIYRFVSENKLAQIDVSELKPGLYIIIVGKTIHRIEVH